jgi:hypothetical protein
MEVVMSRLVNVVLVALAACGPARWTPVEDDDAAPKVADDAAADVAQADAMHAFDAAFGDAKAPEAGKPLAVNLIPNGDFEQGNLLFDSDYVYATSNSTEGQYTVGTSGKLFNGELVPAGDHTTGSSLMFIGNGDAKPDRVWFVGSITVTPGTDYYFEAFVMNLCCDLGSQIPMGPAVLSFYANGQLLGTRTSSKLGVWEGLTTSWNSGSATTVDLKLVNANTEAMGNDFAVDDVYLGTVSTVLPN